MNSSFQRMISCKDSAIYQTEVIHGLYQSVGFIPCPNMAIKNFKNRKRIIVQYYTILNYIAVALLLNPTHSSVNSYSLLEVNNFSYELFSF